MADGCKEIFLDPFALTTISSVALTISSGAIGVAKISMHAMCNANTTGLGISRKWRSGNLEFIFGANFSWEMAKNIYQAYELIFILKGYLYMFKL